MDLAAVYEPILRRFRADRMRRFQQLFRLADGTRVLDVGGSLFNWQWVTVTPGLTIVNLHGPPAASLPPHVRWVVGDGRWLPFQDEAFDVVYSNSVIEHLGDFAGQEAFAAETTRVGRACYLQTPNRGFFLEPHYLTPFIHFLPLRWRRRVLRRGTVWGLLVRPSPEQCEQMLREIRLVSRAELQRLYPAAAIRSERFLGFTKSLLVLKMPLREARSG